MVILRDILILIWEGFMGVVRFFAERTTEAGVEVDPLILIGLVVILTIWLGSGMWASSIAASRRHSGKLHMAGGLLIPYLYPLIIMFALDIKGTKERERQKVADEEKRQAEEEEKKRIAEMMGRAEAEAEEQEQSFTPEYFDSIARDEEGNPTGPWRIVFGDTEVKALRIIEPLPEALSVEIEGRDGEPQKFRIPYSRITECEPC